MHELVTQFKNNQVVMVDTADMFQIRIIGHAKVLGFAEIAPLSLGWIVLMDDPAAAGFPVEEYPFSAIVLPASCLKPVDDIATLK
jgi:hypothetical protein